MGLVAWEELCSLCMNNKTDRRATTPVQQTCGDASHVRTESSAAHYHPCTIPARPPNTYKWTTTFIHSLYRHAKIDNAIFQNFPASQKATFEPFPSVKTANFVDRMTLAYGVLNASMKSEQNYYFYLANCTLYQDPGRPKVCQWRSVTFLVCRGTTMPAQYPAW